MTDREKFEAFAATQGLEVTSFKPDGRYWSSHTHMAWVFWQASRKQMAEEAADVCDGLIPTACSTNMADVSRNQGIRALATPRRVTSEEDEILRAATRGSAVLVAKGRLCHCQACDPQGNGFDTPMRMILCATCGNKRCPHATDHRNACTNSNEPGQKGSSWEGVRSLATPTEGKT